jgi:hypothetical protein
MAYTFRWTSGYMNCTEYEVCGDGPSYRVEVRNGVCDYEHSIYNHTSPFADWNRDVVAAIGLMKRSGSCDKPIRQEVVDAFNDWRQRTWQDWIGKMKAQPERYGEIDESDPIFAKPAIVRGAYYRVGSGWIVNGEELAKTAA